MAEVRSGGDEASLTRTLQEGSEADRRRAFRTLYERHAGALLGYLLRQTGTRHLAEDLTQETFLKAYDRLESYAGRSSLRTWLYTIARNLVIDERRKGGRMISADMDGSQIPTSVPGPIETAERNEEHRRLGQAVQGLPDDLRSVVVLVRLEGMKYAEAAEVLGTTVGTVRMRVHRAHLALVAALGR